MVENDSAALRRDSILLVEDSRVEAEILRRTLVRGGYQVTVAHDGQEALTLAEADPPALVMSDVRMPVMNGYELCRAIRGNPRLASTPVILLSVLSEPDDIIEAANAGADSYTIKPYTEASLLGRIDSLLSRPGSSRPKAREIVEVEYHGKLHRIAADPEQLLNLMLSVYENTLMQNREMRAIQAQLSALADSLEEKVQERTAALEESEDRFRAAFEQAAVGIAHVGLDGRFLRVNRKFCEMVGYSEDEVCRRNFIDFSYPPDRDIGVAEFRQSVAGRITTFTAEKRYLRSDGTVIWVRLTASGVQSAKTGEIRHEVFIIEDVTERKLAEESLRSAQTQIGLAASIAMLGFWQHDLRTDATYLSPIWKKQLGYEDEELPNRYDEWVSRLHPDDSDYVKSQLSRYLDGPVGRTELELEFRLRHKDGSYRWIASRITCVREEGVTPVRIMGTHLDITSRKETEEQIRQVSQHDHLTGLPNRGLLYEFAEHLLSSARRAGSSIAFLFIDLDRFKPINDTYGHNVGDAVLKEVSRRIAQCVRGEDVVGRLGGDEFLAVLSHVKNEEAAARAALHCLKCLDSPYLVNGMEFALSTSIGISLFPQDGTTVDDLVRSADTAMYHAKDSGRNNFQFFKRELNERALQALRIENRLRKGLEQDEFKLHYQPVMDIDTGAVVGAEALLRWPASGAGPDQFVPVAEKAGFMHVLGEWVVKEACRQQRAWRDKGMAPFPVAVNVSPTQFRQKNFAATVSEALEAAGVDPRTVRVEVTESTLMRSVDEAAEILRALRDMGVAVALDDFGTGYSSLSTLSQLPIDVLKLDQSFVKNLGRDPTNVAITEGIIALGQSLGLEVVAEGIESEEAIAFLKAKRCRRGQGFHFCRPLSAEMFEKWYRDRVRHH